MFVIQKTTGSQDGVGNTYRHKAFANASFYVNDLAKNNGRSKAKTYVLWMSGDAVDEKRCGVTRFPTADDAKRVLDHYPFAFGRGCKVVTADAAREDARLFRQFLDDASAWTRKERDTFPVNPFKTNA